MAIELLLLLCKQVLHFDDSVLVAELFSVIHLYIGFFHFLLAVEHVDLDLWHRATQSDQGLAKHSGTSSDGSSSHNT
eukprot:COSAG06_NODE_22754_length_714_cov_0.673171_1_plen_76_part_10